MNKSNELAAIHALQKRLNNDAEAVVRGLELKNIEADGVVFDFATYHRHYDTPVIGFHNGAFGDQLEITVKIDLLGRVTLKDYGHVSGVTAYIFTKAVREAMK